MCFLIVYLSPLQTEDPFAGIRLALARDSGTSGMGPTPASTGLRRQHGLAYWRWQGRRRHSPLDGIPLGPRTSHDPARGDETLRAYRQWAEHAGGQACALLGEQSWTPQRRFERVFERLALPGFGRMGRYELLVTLGRLGLYELQADSLHLAAGRGTTGLEDLTTVAAKRVFAIGEPIYLERRAVAFAQELSVGIDVARPGVRQLGSRRARHPRLQVGHARSPCLRARPRRARALKKCRPLGCLQSCAMPLCFIEPQDAIRVIAESVGREARRQLVGEVVRAWVDDIPDQELSVHYAKAIADLDEDDLHLLAAWHASLEVGQPIPNTDFLVGVFPSLGENRREALKIAAGFRGEEAFQAGVSEEQALDTVLPCLSRERAIELAHECIQLYTWDRLGCDN